MNLTGTSYAILGLLAIQPWSTYELTKQMNRSLRQVWPRTESNLYEEPKRLVDAGLASATERLVGRRRRTEYTITPEGRAALIDWLSRPAAPTLLESEAMIKVLYGNYVPTDTLIGHLKAFAIEAETEEAPWRQIARDYVADRGQFPERLHVNTLYWVLLDRWARLRADWARWAASQVAAWPDSTGPSDRGAVKAMLAKALEDGGAVPALEHPNATAYRKAADAFRAGDLQAIEELVDTDVIWHVPGKHLMAGDIRGRAALVAWLGDLVGTGFWLREHDVFANDEHVCALSLMGARRPGVDTQTRVVSIFHFRAGRQVERWFYPDDPVAWNLIFP